MAASHRLPLAQPPLRAASRCPDFPCCRRRVMFRVLRVRAFLCRRRWISRKDGTGQKFRVNIKNLPDLEGRVAIITGGWAGGWPRVWRKWARRAIP